eukprot:4680681-Amphidinium_carterae.1
MVLVLVGGEHCAWGPRGACQVQEAAFTSLLLEMQNLPAEAKIAFTRSCAMCPCFNVRLRIRIISVGHAHPVNQNK